MQIEEFLNNPENEEKIKEFVKKLLPPEVDVEKLEADLKAALEAPEGERKEKIKAVLVESGIDFKAIGEKVS